MAEPGEATAKTKEGEEKKVLKFNKKETPWKEQQCSKTCQSRCTGVTQESRIFEGLEWARFVLEGIREVAAEECSVISK